MSNKITGSDLERLINEAMESKQSTPNTRKKLRKPSNTKDSSTENNVQKHAAVPLPLTSIQKIVKTKDSKAEDVYKILFDVDPDDNTYHFENKNGSLIKIMIPKKDEFKGKYVFYSMSNAQFDDLISSSEILTDLKNRGKLSQPDINRTRGIAGKSPSLKRIFFKINEVIDLETLNSVFDPQGSIPLIYPLKTFKSKAGFISKRGENYAPKATEDSLKIKHHRAIADILLGKTGSNASSVLLDKLRTISSSKELLEDDDIRSFLMSDLDDKNVRDRIKRKTGLSRREQTMLFASLVNNIKELSNTEYSDNMEVNKSTWNSIRRAAVGMLARIPKLQKADTKYDPVRKVYGPDLEITQKYKSNTGLGTTPGYITDIFNNSTITQANSLKERLKTLSDFALSIFDESDQKSFLKLQESNGESSTSDTGQTFSNLMVVDFFKKIAKDVGMTDAQRGGFLFENFLALLTGGTVEGGGANVEDIIMPDDQKQIGAANKSVFVSAKLLSENTQVTQAGSTVRNFFKKHGKEARFIYVVAYKLKKGETYLKRTKSTGQEKFKRDQLEFFEFPIFVKDFGINDIPKMELDDQTGKFKAVPGSTVSFFPPSDTISPAKRFKYDPSTAPVDPEDKNAVTRFPDEGEEKEKLDDFESKVSHYDSKKSGTFVFSSEVIRSSENYVGSILIPKNLEDYDKVMDKSYDKLKLNIKNTYTSLANFEADLVSFFSARDEERDSKADDAVESFNTLSSNVGQSLESGSTRSEIELGSRTSNDPAPQNESLNNLVNIKKLIEESFKK